MALHDYPYPSYDWGFQGVDFAYIPMSQALADEMYNDGIRIVGRYIYPTGKGITAQEAQYYINAGINIYFYYEVDTSDALGGYNRGLQNGANCLAEAFRVGVPLETQIYCCCDTGVTDIQAAGVVMQYLAGFNEAFRYEEPVIDPDTGEPVIDPDTGDPVTITKYYYTAGIYGGQNVMQACYNVHPQLLRCQAGAWGDKEFSPIFVRQWLINKNRQAEIDNKIKIRNIEINSQGYATWRGYNVDLVSSYSTSNMWNDGSPSPPTPTPPVPPAPIPPSQSDIPIWFYLKKF